MKVNYQEDRKIETLFSSPVVTSSTPKERPARLEPLIEEIESSDNTPSYEYKEVCIYIIYIYIIYMGIVRILFSIIFFSKLPI